MKKNWFIVLVVLIIISAGIISLFSFTDFSILPKKEITFRITWDDQSSRGIAVEKIVEDYNDSQKRIHVTMIGGNEEKRDYLYLLNQNTVDVFVLPYRYIKDDDISEQLLNLEDIYITQQDNYYDAVKGLVERDQGEVGIPWIGHSMALIYNKTLIEQAGVKPEELRSMQDLLAACERVAQSTEAKGLGLVGAEAHDLSWMVSQFIYSFGGELVETDTEGNQTAVKIDSEQNAEALTFYINKLGPLAQDGWQEDTGIEVMEAFANSEIAFEIQGPWGITDIWKRGNPFEVGAISFAQLGMNSEIGPLLLAVNGESENIEADKEFVEYMIQKETLEKIMNGEYDEKYEAYYPYRVPLRKDMEDSIFFKRYPEFLVFIEGYKRPSINTVTAEWENEYKDLYEHYLHEAIIGNISIEDALRNIASKKDY